MFAGSVSRVSLKVAWDQEGVGAPEWAMPSFLYPFLAFGEDRRRSKTRWKIDDVGVSREYELG